MHYAKLKKVEKLQNISAKENSEMCMKMTSAIPIKPIYLPSSHRINPGNPAPSSKALCRKNLFGAANPDYTQNEFEREQERSIKSFNKRYKLEENIGNNASGGQDCARGNLIEEELRNHEKKSEQCNFIKNVEDLTTPPQQIRRIVSDADVSSTSAVGKGNRQHEKQKNMTDFCNKRKRCAVSSSIGDRSAIATQTTTQRSVKVFSVPKSRGNAEIVAADSSCCANEDVSCDCTSSVVEEAPKIVSPAIAAPSATTTQLSAGDANAMPNAEISIEPQKHS